MSRGSDLWGTVFPGKVIDGQVSERELGDIRGSGPVYRCDVNGIPCLSLGHGIEFTVPPADALEWQVSTMHDWSCRILFLDRERCILVVEASNASFPAWRHRYGLEQGVGVTWIDLKGPGLGLSSADEFAHLVLRTPKGLLWDQDKEACIPSSMVR